MRSFNIKKKFSCVLIIIFFVLLGLLSIFVLVYTKYPELRRTDIEKLNSLKRDLGYNEINIVDAKIENFVERINKIIESEIEIRDIKDLEDQKAAIIKRFDEKVTEYLQHVKKYSQLDLTYLPTDVNSIEFRLKKNSDSYIADLKKVFKQKLIAYNQKAEHPLRFEIDPAKEVENMTIDDKVAQMFVFGIKGTSLDEGESNYLKSQKPGGVVFLGENISSSLKSFTDSIQKTNTKYPLFIQVDQEGGTVKRITWDDTPAPKQIAALKSEDQCKEFEKRTSLLESLGINWNLGIVADVTGNQSSFIYWRTYGSDFNAVGNIINTAVTCSNKLLTTLKHFPGHGSTLGDTHLGPLDINTSQADWEKNEALPFRSGIKAGVDSLMIGHLRLKWLDPANPASLSQQDITYIRDTLKYDGILITDDLKMLEVGGFTKEDALRKAMTAGNDVLLYSYSDIVTKNYLIDFAKNEIKNGLITEAELNKRVVRIINAKNKIIKSGDYIPKELIY